MKLGAMNHDLRQNVRARKLRSEMSVSEKVLWEQLRKQRLGFAFRRQVPVGPYIMDFYCARAALCIEVDGEQHEQTRWQDAKRDAYLRKVGIDTIRVPSLALFSTDTSEFAGWLRKITELCELRSSKLPPSDPEDNA